ncbi:MAG: hypothetical protein AAF607_15405 [Pseudomonadota bacterium]
MFDKSMIYTPTSRNELKSLCISKHYKKKLILLVKPIWKIIFPLCIFLLSLSFIKSAFSSGCPDETDLKNGIVFEKNYANYKYKMHHRKIDNSIFWQSYRLQFMSNLFESSHYQGLFKTSFLISNSVEDGKIYEKIKYLSDLSDILPLNVGEKFSIQTVRSAGSKKNVTFLREYSVLSKKSVDIGNCTYDGISIGLDRYMLDNNTKKTMKKKSLLYIPELKFIIYDSLFDSKYKYNFVRRREQQDVDFMSSNSYLK